MPKGSTEDIRGQLVCTPTRRNYIVEISTNDETSSCPRSPLECRCTERSVWMLCSIDAQELMLTLRLVLPEDHGRSTILTSRGKYRFVTNIIEVILILRHQNRSISRLSVIAYSYTRSPDSYYSYHGGCGRLGVVQAAIELT